MAGSSIILLLLLVPCVGAELDFTPHLRLRGVWCALLACCPLGPLRACWRSATEHTRVHYKLSQQQQAPHICRGGGVGLLLWFLHWYCVAYRWRMVHRRVRNPVLSAAACRAFPSVIPRDPCVVDVVEKRRGGSISAGQCKILKKGEGKQTMCKKYEKVHLTLPLWGGGLWAWWVGGLSPPVHCPVAPEQAPDHTPGCTSGSCSA